MKLWRGVQNFFHQPKESGISYSTLRIIFAVNSILYLLISKPFLHVFYGAESICPVPSGAWLYWNDVGRFSFFRLFQTPAQVELIWYLALANSLLLLVGYQIRLTTIFQYLFISSFMLSFCFHTNYGDYVFSATSFLMMFLPSKDPWSLDWYFAKRQTNARAAPALEFSPWLKKTLMIFLCVLYLASCLPRFAGGPWMTGSAAWIALIDPITSYIWSDVLAASKQVPPIIFYMFTYVAMVYEMLVPILIWSNRFRRYILFFGLFFHALLAICLDVGLFSFHMSLLLAACFKYDDKLQSAGKK